MSIAEITKRVAGHWRGAAALSLFISVIPGTVAEASSYTTLGLPAKPESVTAIGDATLKEPLKLDLGGLRTRDAQLPGGSRTLRERMAMRAKLRERRMQAVTDATRDRMDGEEDGTEIFIEPGEGGTEIDMPQSSGPSEPDRMRPGEVGSDY